MVATLERSSNADIGVPTGTTVTVGNSGGGTGNAPFTTVTVPAGTTLQVSNVAPITGGYSYVAALASTGNLLEAKWALAAPRPDVTWDAAFTIPATRPTVATSVARFYTDIGGTQLAAVLWLNPDATFAVNAYRDTRTSPPTSVPAAPGNYVGKLRSSPGQITFDVYPYGSATAATSIAMTGLTPFQVGSVAVIALTVASGAGSITWKTGALRVGYGGYLPRLDVTTTPPTCSTGPAAYATVGDTIPMSGTDTAPAGAITGRAWTWDTLPDGITAPAIVGAGTANATFTPTVQGYYRAQYTVTDNQGSDSTPAYMATWVAPAAGDPVTVRTDTIGPWMPFGGGATSIARINDTDNTTGIISPGDPTAAPYIARMNPHGPGAVTLTVTGNSTNGDVTRTVKWYKTDGTTLIDTQTGTAPTSSGDQTFTMSDEGLALIQAPADRAELWVHIESTKT